MDNTTKELLEEAGSAAKDLTLGLVKVAAGTVKFLAQSIIDLCNGEEPATSSGHKTEDKDK